MDNNLSSLLTENLFKNGCYLEALNIAKNNSEGRIWLIGSGVYKTLINILYGGNHEIKDWDFIAEKVVKSAVPTEGLKVSETKHGNPKITKGDLVIDLVALDNIHSIKERGLMPKIENYLSGTMLTIQSIAFDIGEQLVIGDVGQRSILSRSVGINNKAEYDYATDIYGDKYSAEIYARKLGFNID